MNIPNTGTEVIVKEEAEVGGGNEQSSEAIP